ncbi:MAG: hypothetical protein ACREV7_10655 [Steroidobacteraceae bacterium]
MSPGCAGRVTLVLWIIPAASATPGATGRTPRAYGPPAARDRPSPRPQPGIRARSRAFSRRLIAYRVDGFRLDAAWPISSGSIPTSDYVTHGFDAAYDWTSRLGQWVWNGYGGIIVHAGVGSRHPARP